MRLLDLGRERLLSLQAEHTYLPMSEVAQDQGASRCVLYAWILELRQRTPTLSMYVQKALEALISDWMGVLSSLRRLWEADEVMRLVTSPGEENPPHTPLATLVDAGDFRALVVQLQQSWQESFAQAEAFRQVSQHAHQSYHAYNPVKMHQCPHLIWQ